MPATTHGAPGSGGFRRRQRAAANEPIGAGSRESPTGGEAVPTPRTLVIIPAWNEEEALPGTLGRARAVRPDLDVLVVSDGSTDRTADVAARGGRRRRRASVQPRYRRRAADRLPVRGAPPATSARCSSTPTASTTRRRSRRSSPALDDGADMVVGSRFGEGTVEYRVGPLRRAAMRVAALLDQRDDASASSPTRRRGSARSTARCSSCSPRPIRWSSWTRRSRCSRRAAPA